MRFFDFSEHMQIDGLLLWHQLFGFLVFLAFFGFPIAGVSFAFFGFFFIGRLSNEKGDDPNVRALFPRRF